MTVKIKIGERYGKLQILKEAKRKSNRRFVKCQCDCGKEKEIALHNLRNGHTSSCGCSTNYYSTHGMRNTNIYGVFYSILDRCNNSNSKKYKKLLSQMNKM